MKTYNIDVYGEQISQGEIIIENSDGVFRFIIDPMLKVNERFHLGVFSSKAVISKEIFRYPRNQRIALLTESPLDNCYKYIPEIIKRFPVIFTHQQYLLQKGEPFKPLMFGTNWISVQDSQSTRSILEEHPEKTSLVSFMGSLNHPDNGAYRFRRNVANYVMDRQDVDCFGKGIKEVAGKREAISPYYFSIAMENTASNYYFSEKLIDCFLLETVPIYYGCSDITDLFDPRGILIFKTLDELISILENLSPRLYESMHPYLIQNKIKALRENWHSHEGMFSRLLPCLLSNVLTYKATHPYEPGSFRDKTLIKIRQLQEICKPY